MLSEYLRIDQLNGGPLQLQVHTASVHTELGEVPGRDTSPEAPASLPPPPAHPLGVGAPVRGSPSTLLSLRPTVDLVSGLSGVCPLAGSPGSLEQRLCPFSR